MSTKSLAFVIADDPAYLPWLETALGEPSSLGGGGGGGGGGIGSRREN